MGCAPRLEPLQGQERPVGFGVVRQTVQEWLGRYAADGGLAGLADRSSRPLSCPHQMLAVVAGRVVALRVRRGFVGG